MMELPFYAVVFIGLLIVGTMIAVVAGMIKLGNYLARKKKP